MTASAHHDFVVEWGSSTHPGFHRSDNEDALLARLPVFLIADGMGGHDGGREASSYVVQAFDKATGDGWLTVDALNHATARASTLVRHLDNGTGAAPGSTVSGVGVTSHEGVPTWLVFNIGDSRTYCLRSGRLDQVTVDHSEVQDLVDGGATRAEARARGATHVITRAIGGGMSTIPAIDQWLMPALEGDRMLVCSDGLTNELSDGHITTVLETHADPDRAAEQLVDAALACGGRDNVSVIVIDAIHVAGGTRRGGRNEDTVPDLRPLQPEATVPDLPVITLLEHDEEPV